jgi:arylsulfatase
MERKRTSTGGARRPSGRWVGLAALLVASACGGTSRPRGVLLLSVDSLRADHLSCAGYRSPTRPDLDTTPVIDREIAGRGARFANALSTSSWTLPAHLALLTGLPNELHGVRDIPERLPATRRLLAECFRDAGWRTAGFFSGPNLHPWFGFDRGFELYADCSAAPVADPEIFGVEPRDRAGFDDVRALHDRSHQGITGPGLVASFARWFEGLGPDERFFAFLHFWDVHYDYTPPAEYDLFDPGYRGTWTGAGFNHTLLHPPTDARDVMHLQALYDGEVLFTDAQIGEVLAELEAAERGQDTLVVLVADHGDEFMEHGMLGHRNSLFEEVVRVPLCLRLPGAIDPGLVVDELVSLVDVAPTILDLAGVAWGGAASDCAPWGRSLRRALEGTSLGVRPAPLELTVRAVPIQNRGLHAGDHKVIRERARGDPNLYDLRRDALERRPIQLGENRAADQRIDAALAFWAELDALAAELGAAGSGTLPSELGESLQAAGYVGAAEPDGEDDGGARRDG